MKTIRIHLLFFAIFISLSCAQDTGNCPTCYADEEEAPVVPSTTVSDLISVNWIAMKDAPTVVNPFSYCTGDVPTFLYFRTVIPFKCVWSQCKINNYIDFLSSTHKYPLVINDPDLSIGNPGDVVDNSAIGGGLTPEELNLIYQSYNYWGKRIGIYAIAIRSFWYPPSTSHPNGNQSAVAGIGFRREDPQFDGFILPFLIIRDPTFQLSFLSDRNIMAHEMGHIFGLGHPNAFGGSANDPDAYNPPLETEDPAINLMYPQSGSSAKLEINQCNRASMYINGLKSQFDFFIDSPSPNNIGIENQSNGLEQDLFYFAIRYNPLDKGLRIFISPEQIIKEAVTYYITFDIDNNTRTGLNVKELVPHCTQAGVEMVLKIEINSNCDLKEVELYSIKNNAFQPLPLPKRLLDTKIYNINKNSYTENDGCISTPAFSQIKTIIPREVLQMMGTLNDDKVIFPNGLRTQAISYRTTSDKKEVIDHCPDTIGLMNFQNSNSRKQMENK